MNKFEHSRVPITDEESNEHFLAGVAAAAEQELEPPEWDYEFIKAPDPFPELPNFGILYLTVPQAATLLADNLALCERYPFTELKAVATNLQREKQHTDERDKLAKNLQLILKESVRDGRLASFHRVGSLKDFIDHQNAQFQDDLTYIHYKDLKQWLFRSGYLNEIYEPKLGLLGKYESRELCIAKEINGLVQLRRAAHNATEFGLTPLKYKEFYSYNEYAGLDEMLSQAIAQIKDLEEKLQKTSASVQEPAVKALSNRESQSILTVLAAVCKMKGINIRSKDITAAVEREANELGRPITNNTVRKWLDKAINILAKH